MQFVFYYFVKIHNYHQQMIASIHFTFFIIYMMKNATTYMQPHMQPHFSSLQSKFSEFIFFISSCCIKMQILFKVFDNNCSTFIRLVLQYLKYFITRKIQKRKFFHKYLQFQFMMMRLHKGLNDTIKMQIGHN